MLTGIRSNAQRKAIFAKKGKVDRGHGLSSDSLKEELSITDQNTGMKYVWRGGNTINVYDSAGNNVNAHTVGDQRSGGATPEEVRQGVQRIIDEADRI